MLPSWKGPEGRLIPAHAGKTGWTLICVSSGRAHPRSRGENMLLRGAAEILVGSSPLTRGKRVGEVHAECLWGLIPAHAGKTSSLASGQQSSTAHPRSRGENASRLAAKNSRSGSSPLTRGKLAESCGLMATRGLIPAHAGKTTSTYPAPNTRKAHPRSRGENWTGSADGPGVAWLIPAHAGKTIPALVVGEIAGAHPRSRGENIWNTPWSSLAGGSSPLTRGKHRDSMDQHRPIRLIPAHAGKTTCSAAPPVTCPAHPRSRGENPTWPPTWHARPGSSPLTRGKRGSLGRCSRPAGLIPAHAGKTTSFMGVPVAVGAHPRSRGENASASCAYPSTPGSSPLTRGKLERYRGFPHARRLIPAHAGKTSGSMTVASTSGAHPRSRGENPSISTLLYALRGSSPLTRGKPGQYFRDRAPRRLIPAHAGKTRPLVRPDQAVRAHPRSRGENVFISPGLW